MQSMVAMPVEKLQIWLNTINPNKVAPSIRPNVKFSCCHKPTTGADGKIYQMLAMPVDKLPSALDAYIAAQPDPKPSRPEAIRRLVEKALASP